MAVQIKTTGVCSDCGNDSNMTVAQTVINGTLKWYKSYSCQSCGAAEEIDGTGFPPEEIRDKILENEGRWKILFLHQKMNKAAAMKVLRGLLNLSLAETKQMLDRLPPEPLSQGTKTEMLWIKGHLEHAGVQVEVQPAD